MIPIPIRLVVVAAVALAQVGACRADRPSNGAKSARMPDRRQWTVENLAVNMGQSYCYDDAELNCRQYGRLYTWASAQKACESLGAGWRLPSDDDWRRLARHYGGARGDSGDGGTSAYKALLIGGSSGFDARLGGGRDHDAGRYARLEAHGFYWTATETSASEAVFYNFGRGGSALNRQPEGEKQRAFSVRCLKP
jgi:uncharacterized protein (TIGR02145 family)